jgi:hypothetical protein
MKRPPASNAETKIAELAERKLRFDHPELSPSSGDKIQRRECEAMPYAAKLQITRASLGSGR